jgi:hydroxyethylthiazole kinase-like uncharacterized protein yjeF
MIEHITRVPALPSRAADANKGDCGKVVIVGGSRGMAGAPCLAARAAYRGGAGLVRLVVPASIWDVAAVKLDECLVEGLGKEKSVAFELSVFKQLAQICAWGDVITMGPGMSQAPQTVKLIQRVVAEVDKTLVLDADALNAFKDGGTKKLAAAQKKFSKRTVILTPHPGEMARLLSILPRDVQADRANAALEVAQATGAIVVLKGAGTLVCDGKRLYENTTGNPGMATGGTGDVLAGLLGALAGQGLSGFDAAVLAVYLHGLAGDIAAKRTGEWSLIAGDLVNALPEAFLKRQVQ